MKLRAVSDPSRTRHPRHPLVALATLTFTRTLRNDNENFWRRISQRQKAGACTTAWNNTMKVRSVAPDTASGKPAKRAPKIASLKSVGHRHGPTWSGNPITSVITSLVPPTREILCGRAAARPPKKNLRNSKRWGEGRDATRPQVYPTPLLMSHACRFM